MVGLCSRRLEWWSMEFWIFVTWLDGGCTVCCGWLLGKGLVVSVQQRDDGC